MGEGSWALTLLSLVRERERERGREVERERSCVPYVEKSIAVHTRICSAPGIILVLSDLMEDMQAWIGKAACLLCTKCWSAVMARCSPCCLTGLCWSWRRTVTERVEAALLFGHWPWDISPSNPNLPVPLSPSRALFVLSGDGFFVCVA